MSRKDSDGVAMAIGAVVALLCTAFALSCITAGMWYCFDDALASLTGVEQLGRMNFWNVYAFTFFMSSLFKATLSTKNS